MHRQKCPGTHQPKSSAVASAAYLRTTNEDFGECEANACPFAAKLSLHVAMTSKGTEPTQTLRSLSFPALDIAFVRAKS